MKRLFKASLLLASLGAAVAVSAAPIYLIDATTDMLPPDPGFANVAFSLTYEDFNFNQLFSLDELLAFTGYTDGMGNFFSMLLSVPTAPGITGSGPEWQFGDGQNTISFAANTFTPFTQGAGVLPVPASGLLVGLGLTALAAVSRRRQK